MERTDYVAKAKSLMMSTVRTTALVIVPLAAAVNAHASIVTLPIGSVSCATTIDSGSGPSGGSCSGGAAQLPDLGSGVQGMKFRTVADITFFLSSGSGMTVTMSTGGSVNGDIPLGTVIPVSALFDLTTGGGATITSWELLFSLGTSGGGAQYGSALIDCIATASCSGGSGIGGSSSLVVGPTGISDTSSLFETVKLTFSATVPLTATVPSVTVHVPSSSWNFDSVAATSAVPEPASLGLMASGLALIGAWNRRRKR